MTASQSEDRKTKPSGRKRNEQLPKPFIKWAGGKGQLAGELLRMAPVDFNAYHEPFMGGAALFFALQRDGRLKGKRVVLSDINHELVGTYRAIQRDVGKVIDKLRKHQRKFRGLADDERRREYFYSVRQQDPTALGQPAMAARMIFLNRTGFNGLYRVNSKGKFNVPFGRYKNPLICDEDNLEAVAKALAGVELAAESFDSVLKNASRGDFVYFDPPYVPLSATAYFVSYARSGFGPKDQEKLAETMRKLKAKGVSVMLSNSDTREVKRMYKDKFQIQKVAATRRINSKADKRGSVNELVVTSYKPKKG